MRHESTKSLYQYWDRIRGNRAAPGRVEIEPSDIRNLLGDTFILDISGTPRMISYRLAGTKLCAAYGKELKGVGFLVPWDEGDCFELTSALSRVYNDNKPQLVVSLGKTESGRFVEFETILLPLASADTNAKRILGLSAPKKTPFWMGAEPIVSNSLRSIRTATLPKSSDFERATLAPNMYISADTNAIDGIINQASDTHKPNIRKVAHLTILDGGKS